MKSNKYYIVTNADKNGITIAYQKLIAGDPRYKPAPHLIDDDEYIRIMTQHDDGP